MHLREQLVGQSRRLACVALASGSIRRSARSVPTRDNEEHHSRCQQWGRAAIRPIQACPRDLTSPGPRSDKRPYGDHGRDSGPSAFRMQCECNTMVLMFKAVRDSDWSANHIAAHNVTLDEVREAILERPYWSAPGRDGTTLVYGQTHAGRHLLVVAVDEGGQAFVVTARDMTDAEKKTFHRKAR